MAIFRIPVNLTWPGAGSPGVNVFHLRTTESSGSASNDLIVDEALGILSTWYQEVFNRYGVGGLTWSMGESILDVETLEAFDRPVLTQTASPSSEAAAPVLALVVGWRTSLAARRGRGRTFIGPLRASVVSTNGTPDDTVLTAIRGYTSTFVADSNAIAGGSFAVYGQQNPGLETPRVARDITAARIRDTFAVLRSRRD